MLSFDIEKQNLLSVSSSGVFTLMAIDMLMASCRMGTRVKSFASLLSPILQLRSYWHLNLGFVQSNVVKKITLLQDKSQIELRNSNLDSSVEILVFGA